MSDDALAPRQESILRALVREYIRTGEPVGSVELVRRYRLNVSSATVRNEMSRLEEIGYLAQPHTSAGRVPTDRAYRLFVDAIEPPLRLPRDDENLVHDELTREPESLEDLLHRATEVTSRITHQAAAVLAPRLAPSRLRNINLVLIGTHAATVVIVADNGRVEQRIIRFERVIEAQELEQVERELNRDLRDMRFEDARRTVADRLAAAPTTTKPVLAGVIEALDQTLVTESHVYVGGAANLAEEESFQRETLRRLYEVLERQSELLTLLAGALAPVAGGDAAPVVVRIGHELPMPAMRDCSIVVANYGFGETPAGIVGVIGPTRMDYRRVMAAAEAVARTLQDTLGQISE